MYKIKLKWVVFLSFFTVMILYSIFSFFNFKAVKENAERFSIIEGYSSDRSKNHYLSSNFTGFISGLESLALKEKSWNDYKIPLVNWLGKIYFEDDQGPTLSPLWGDSALFFERDQPWLIEMLQRIKINPGEVFFHSNQANEKPLLYFFYMNKESPSFIYTGGVNIIAMEDKLIGLTEHFQSEKKSLYIINNDTILSPVSDDNASLQYIVSHIATKRLNGGYNNKSIKIHKGNSLIDYMPIFISSNSLWLLVANRSEYQNSLYEKNKLLFFALPVLFLAFLIFLAVYLVFRPMFLMSDMVGREGSNDAEKLHALTSEIMIRGKHICFFEMYRVLSVFEKMADELSSYQKDTEYKHNQHKKAVAQEYFERLRYEKQQRKKAIYDNLTGLPNGFLLEDRIATVIKHNTSVERRTYLILINIMGIKDVGEEYSHIVSDSMLKSLAVRLNEKVGHSGTLYRYDYCQFVVLLTGLKRDYYVQAFVKHLFSVINNPGPYVDSPLSEGIVLPVSCSIGVSEANSPMFTAKKLIEAASENAELCISDKHNVLTNIFDVKRT